MLCGGIPGVEIKTVRKVVLSIGIELPTEDFFDEHYLVRNLASLFGIPPSRMRTPKIVAGSTRRRLAAGTSLVDVDLYVEAEDMCSQVETCGLHGACSDGECVCDVGWGTPTDGPEPCTDGDCLCSREVGCPDECDGCHANGTCVRCASVWALLLDGACLDECPAPTVAVYNDSGVNTCGGFWGFGAREGSG